MKALSVGNNYLNEVTRDGPAKAVVVSKEVLIAAPVDCFGTIAKQLERPAEWDGLTRVAHLWPLWPSEH